MIISCTLQFHNRTKHGSVELQSHFAKAGYYPPRIRVVKTDTTYVSLSFAKNHSKGKLICLKKQNARLRERRRAFIVYHVTT